MLRRAGIRLAQVANFLGPSSGGLRVVVEELGRAHLAQGGDRILVLPAPESSRVTAGRDLRLAVASPALPGSGGRYHVLLRRREVLGALEAFGPDVVEVHDQTTLTWVARWAREVGVPSVLFSHERLDLVAEEFGRLPAGSLQRAGGRWSARLAARFDEVICASDFAAAPFTATGATNVRRVPFGVDLDCFAPGHETSVRWEAGRRRLAFADRMWHEKAPHVALDVLAELVAAGVPAQLAMVGAGPLESSLRRRARRERLPVTFAGHQRDRQRLAGLLGSADVVLSPGHRETFGLGVLEAMACGTPVVVSTRGASHELLGPGAGWAAGSAAGMALAVRRLLRDPQVHDAARRAARERAEQFSWAASVQALNDRSAGRL